MQSGESRMNNCQTPRKMGSGDTGGKGPDDGNVDEDTLLSGDSWDFYAWVQKGCQGGSGRKRGTSPSAGLTQ